MLSLRECVVEPVERYFMIDQSVAAIPLHYSDVALLKSYEFTITDHTLLIF